MYLLDTNICIYLIKDQYPKVLDQLKSKSPEEILVSAVTVGELFYGVSKSVKKELNKLALIKFLSPFEILPFRESDTESYGQIRAKLEDGGNIIGPYDLQIGAQAVSNSLILVTNNEKEFRRIPGLRIENWISG